MAQAYLCVLRPRLQGLAERLSGIPSGKLKEQAPRDLTSPTSTSWAGRGPVWSRHRPLGPLHGLSLLLGFSRFCVGDKFFLKNNMILCQMDYEEGQLNGTFEPQVQ